MSMPMGVWWSLHDPAISVSKVYATVGWLGSYLIQMSVEYVLPIARRPPLRTPQKVALSRIPQSGTIMRRMGYVCRHRTLWYDDGNIAITAPMADGRNRLFLLHQCTLVDHSEPLRRMIQKTEAFVQFAPEYTKIPSIELADDAADVENFIFAIYRIDKPCVNLDFDTVNGALRLAIKYEVSHLAIKLRTFYASQWPRTLEQWDVEDGFNTAGSQDTGNLPDFTADDILFQDPAAAIRLARDCRIPEILPIAFYHLSRVSRETDWFSRSGAHSSISSLTNSPTSSCSSLHSSLPAFPSFSTKWNLLTQEDHETLLRGKEGIQAFLMNVWVPAVLERCDQNCTDPLRSCQSHMHSVTSLYDTGSDLVAEKSCYLDPLRTLRRRFCTAVEQVQVRYNLCESCARSVCEVAVEARAQLWHLLPLLFGLDVDGGSGYVREMKAAVTLPAFNSVSCYASDPFMLGLQLEDSYQVF
ncbi:hypothetical protein BXZ70DRAFT_920734 [Cristinia sonorae]|uniref:BTB domain-containing protein n=1 Tax=Cristinia sonorae TaxID=1940300 RepID=A0A8K0UV36_9AGAR|nr:hypothetical protein BXZ70DRAFT_920734 [Cristinia sonorae]